MVNWAKRHNWEVRKLKYEGRRGAFDWLFYKGRVALFMEMKQETGKLSKHQKVELECLKKQNMNWAVCYDSKEGVRILQMYDPELDYEI